MTPESAGRRSHLGELLVEAGFVSEEDVQAALAHQRRVGDLPLGEILVERGLLSRLALAEALGEQWSAENRQLRLVTEAEPSSGESGAETGEHLAELREAIAELRDLVSLLEAVAGKAFIRAHSADAELHRLVEELTGRLDRLDVPTADTAGDGEVQAPLTESPEDRMTAARTKSPTPAGRAAVSRQDRIDRPTIRPMRESLPPSLTRSIQPQLRTDLARG